MVSTENFFFFFENGSPRGEEDGGSLEEEEEHYAHRGRGEKMMMVGDQLLLLFTCPCGVLARARRPTSRNHHLSFLLFLLLWLLLFLLLWLLLLSLMVFFFNVAQDENLCERFGTGIACSFVHLLSPRPLPLSAAQLWRRKGERERERETKELKREGLKRDGCRQRKSTKKFVCPPLPFSFLSANLFFLFLFV